MSNELIVETPAATLKAVDTGYRNDPEQYPGIWIEVDGEGMVLVEFNPDTQNIRVCVWDKDDPDNDPIAIHQLT